jgi:hypothetical protein
MFAVIQFGGIPTMDIQMSQTSALLMMLGIGVFIGGLTYLAEKWQR